MTMSLSDAPDTVDKTIKKVWIKNGKRKMTTSDGMMHVNAELARKMFGKMKGGKYSLKQ